MAEALIPQDSGLQSGPEEPADSQTFQDPDVNRLENVQDSDRIPGPTEEENTQDTFMSKYYPEYMRNVYRVPNIYIGHPTIENPKKYRGISDETVPVYSYGTWPSDVQGDRAEKTVADSIEYLLKYMCEGKLPAFVITSYRHRDFGSNVSSQSENSNVRGEHDVLIIHYFYGIFFIQVKSCDDNPKPYINYACKQLVRDKKFFNRKFGDLKCKVDITQIVALPNISRKQLTDEMNRPEYKDGNQSCSCEDMNKFLYSDDLTVFETDTSADIRRKRERLKTWWDNINANRRGSAQFTQECYETVVERYIGLKSTVQIPHPFPRVPSNEKPDVRRTDHVVSEINTRTTSITLTPYQLAVLSCSKTRLVIRGQYGTGKTIMLILKARMLLRNSEMVNIISMSQSPLIHLLEASVKHDKCYPNLTCVTVKTQSDLIVHLDKIVNSEQRWNVLIDEFPSFLSGNSGLKKVIESFPHNRVFWVICSRERQVNLSRGLKDMFASFQDVVCDIMLRCPSSLHHLFPKFPQKIEKTVVSYPHGKLNKPSCYEAPKRKVLEHLHEIGLSTSLTKEADTTGIVKENTGNKWSDLVVVDLVPDIKRPFYTQLTELKVPLVRVSDVMKFTPKDEEDIKERRCNRALFTNTAHGIPDAVCAAVITDTEFEIFIRGKVKAKPVFEIPNSSDGSSLAEYLNDNGFGPGCSVWYDIIFVDRGECDQPESYVFLRSLNIPLVTLCDHNGIFEDCVIYLKNKFHGYRRKESLVFRSTGNRVDIIANFKHVAPCEGPPPKYIDHRSHSGELTCCGRCEKDLKNFFNHLGLKPKEAGRHLPEHQPQTVSTDESRNVLEQARKPGNDITYADLVIIDDRQDSPSAADLFKRCGVPVVDKHKEECLEPKDAFGSDTEVLYVKSNLFQGLERKCVIVIRSTNQGIRSPVHGEQLNDFIELAISRCSSQLIVIST